MAKKKRDHIGDQEGLKLAYVTDTVTPEEMEKRIVEASKCMNDVKYFAEHYFTILDGKGDKVLIKLFKKQAEFLDKIVANRNIICCASRQVAKSTTYSIYVLHQVIFKKNFFVMIAGNKADTAREILTKIKDAYELIPNWIKPGIKVWNESKIVFDNGCIIKATATTASAARGLSINLLLLDELAFVDRNTQNEFFTSVLPTLASVQNSKVVVCSTPNGAGDLFHKLWESATKDKDSAWIAHRIDWFDVPWRDEAWHQREIKALGSQDKFDQEYGCSFLTAVGDKLITDDKIIKLQEIARSLKLEPINRKVEKDKIDCKYMYKEYFPYEERHTYIGAADVAEGTGNDSSVFYIFDITEGNKIRLCAKFDSSKIITSQFAYVIYHMSQRYNNPYLFIESNSIGIAVIDALTKTLFKYNKIVTNRKDHRPGIFSHVQTKSRACLNVQEIVQSNRYELILPDEDLFKEMSTFEKANTSQHMVYKAKGDAHDDHIMAFIWGMLSLSEEFLKRYFTVEYKIDEDTKAKIPTLIIEQVDDINDAKMALKVAKGNVSMSEADRFKLAAKWRELGDDARADYILSTIYQDQFDETGAVWGNNPYQIDVSKFSEGLFGDRYKGMGRNDNMDYDTTFILGADEEGNSDSDSDGDGGFGWL
jgi:hypothetical protein